MISISNEHYQGLLQLVSLLNKNLTLLHPAHHFSDLFAEWTKINDSFQQFY
jgi:hypothetical protein